MMRKSLLGTLIFWLTVVSAFSQPFEYRFHTYNGDDGLPSLTINDIVEDNHGFLWIGTDNGLCRFDTHKFKVYSNFDNRENGYGNTQVNSLLVDTNGNLWVGTDRSLFYFDTKTETSTDVFKEYNLEAFYITDLVLTNENELWVGTNRGLLRHNLSTNEFRLFSPENNQGKGLTNASIFDLELGVDGRLWITTLGGGLNLYRSETDDFVSYKHDKNDNTTISSNVLREVLALPNGELLIGTESDGFNRMDIAKETFVKYTYNPDDPFSLSSSSAYSFLLDKDENLWIGTWANGLNLFDLENGISRRFVNNPDESLSLPGNIIRTIFQSTSGEIWLGTDGSGLTRLNLKEQEIVRYRHNSKKENSLSKSLVRSVMEDNEGKLWIGTGQAGLNCYDKRSGKFSVYLKPDNSRDELARGTIWSISPGDNNTLWLGTSRGVAKFNKDTEDIKFYSPDDNDSNSVTADNVLKVLDDNNGSLWIGMWYGGLNRMNIETGHVDFFNHDPNDSNSIASNNVNDIFIDSKDRLWVGTDASFSMLMPDGRSFKNHDLTTLMINEDKNGMLWLCTVDGLLRFDPGTGERSFFGKKDGLRSDYASSLLIDENGVLWIGSDNGVECYDPKTGETYFLNKSDGLAGNEQMSRACFLKPGGNVYFGGLEGLSQINPEVLQPQEKKVALQFTDLLLFNKPVNISDSTVLDQSIHTLDRLQLDYTDYIFSLEFAAFEPNQPELVKYAYTLSNFDNEWITTDYTNRKVVYTNVPPGDYTLKVRAFGKRGENYTVEKTIDITIIPPWWQTWWAKVLLYGSILFIGLVAFQVRISVVRRQKEVLEKEVELRTKEVLEQKKEIERQAEYLEKINQQKDKLFSVVSHDLRNPLATLKGTMSLLDPKILKEEELDSIRKDIGDKIDNLSSTIINLLDWAKGQMKEAVTAPVQFEVQQLAQQNIDLYEQVALEKKLTIKNNVPKGLIAHADFNQIGSVFRNLIGNAIKFTPISGMIELSATTDESAITVVVKDTGIGMDSDKLNSLFSIQTNKSSQGTSGEKGVGLGLILVKDFVDKNEGKLWVESEEEIGTSFFFTLKPSFS